MTKKTKPDDSLRAVFTRIDPQVFARLESDAEQQKRSVSQQVALILEQHYLQNAQAEADKPL